MSGIRISRALTRQGLCPRPLSPKIWLGGEPIPGPPPRTTLPSLGTLSPSGRRGRLPPSATSAAAPPPTRAPFSRPSHAGRRAAGHPGLRRPRLPRPRLGPDPRVLLLLWRRRQLGLTRAGAGGRGMVRDASSLACSAPGRIPFQGRGSAPPASAPRPSPAARWICKETPPLDQQATPIRNHDSASSGVATAPPRPLASPGLSTHVNLADTFP